MLKLRSELSSSGTDVLTIHNAIFNTYFEISDEEPFEKFMLNGTYTIKEYCNTKYTRDELWEIHGSNIYHCKAPFDKGDVLLKLDEPKVEEMIQLMIDSTYETKRLPNYLDTSKANKVQKVGGTICPTKEEIFRYNGYVYYLYGRYIYGYNYKCMLFLNKDVDKRKYVRYVHWMGYEDESWIEEEEDGDSEKDEDEDSEKDEDEDSEKDEDEDISENNEDSKGDQEKKNSSLRDDIEEDEEEHSPSKNKYWKVYKEEDVFPKLLSKNVILIPNIISSGGQDYNYCFLIEKEDTNELVAFSMYK